MSPLMAKIMSFNRIKAANKMMNMGYYLKSIKTTLSVTPFFTHLIGAILAILLPYKELLYVLLYLIFADFGTGVWASYKRNLDTNLNGFKAKIKFFWKNFQSSKIRNTVSKCFIYFGLMLTIAIFEKYFFSYTIFSWSLTKLFAVICAIVEMRSILENCCVITTNPLISKFLGLFKKKLDAKQAEIEKALDAGDIIENKPKI